MFGGKQFHGSPSCGVRILLIAQIVGGLHGFVAVGFGGPPIVCRCGNQRVGYNAAVRDGAGFIQIQTIHAGERFHRFQILHKRVMPCQPHGGDGEIERREQHQAFRDHTDDAGDGGDDRLPPRTGCDGVTQSANRVQL